MDKPRLSGRAKQIYQPHGIGQYRPELWEKVQELHEMGMEYLVFMAVANEGRAYYPPY
ncbi:MAG: hypothetical protein ACLUVZ_16065 [Bacteroides stercoris]